MSLSAVVCREIFDENSQPSAEEISEYAQQIGIDPVSESHLLPLAKDGLMQALPAPWKAYFDEKVQTHYYYNPETKKTQWEHPLDKVYKELVKKARDASMQDDTCASVQELLTYEENTRILERVETKVESDDEDLPTDSSRHFDSKQTMPKRLAPLGRPPLAPVTRFDKKLSDLKVSPLRRSIDIPVRPKSFEPDVLKPERPKQLFKQQSEIIDLKINVLGSPDEDNFSPLLGTKLARVERGLPLTGKGSMFFKIPKSDNPSPDTDKSFPLDSMTKSDPPKGILREKMYDSYQRKADAVLGKGRNQASLEEDKKSVRFKLEQLPDPSISPGSNSSSDQNDGQSSIVTPVPSSQNTLNPSSVLNPRTGNPSSVLNPKPANILNPSSELNRSNQNPSSYLNPLNPIPTLKNPGPVILSPIQPRAVPKLDSPKEVLKAFDVIKGMDALKSDGNWMGPEKESAVDSDTEKSSSSPVQRVPNFRSDFEIDIDLDSPKILDSSIEGEGDPKPVNSKVNDSDSSSADSSTTDSRNNEKLKDRVISPRTKEKNTFKEDGDNIKVDSPKMTKEQLDGSYLIGNRSPDDRKVNNQLKSFLLKVSTSYRDRIATAPSPQKDGSSESDEHSNNSKDEKAEENVIEIKHDVGIDLKRDCFERNTLKIKDTTIKEETNSKIVCNNLKQVKDQNNSDDECFSSKSVNNCSEHENNVEDSKKEEDKIEKCKTYSKLVCDTQGQIKDQNNSDDSCSSTKSEVNSSENVRNNIENINSKIDSSEIKDHISREETKSKIASNIQSQIKNPNNSNDKCCSSKRLHNCSESNCSNSEEESHSSHSHSKQQSIEKTSPKARESENDSANKINIIPKDSKDSEEKSSSVKSPKSETESKSIDCTKPTSDPKSIEHEEVNLSQSPKGKSPDKSNESNLSPKRRVVRPPAADYIKTDLFQKNFQKISDLVRPGDIDTSSVHLEIDAGEKDVRPRSPLIPQQKNKISINLMESIESETSSDSPDKEYANLDLNDLDDMQKDSNSDAEEISPQNDVSTNIIGKNIATAQDVSNSSHDKSSKLCKHQSIDDSASKIRVPILDLTKPKSHNDSGSKTIDESKTSSIESRSPKSPQIKSPKFEFNKPWSNSSPLNYKSLNKAVIAPLKPESNKTLGKTLTSPRLDGVMLSQGKSTDNVVVVYQFETQDDSYPKTIKSPLIDPSRDVIERTKADERRRLEINLQKELESIRVEFATRERRMRSELQEELRDAEDKFLEEKKRRLTEQAERHEKEMENALARAEQSHKESMEEFMKSIEERRKKDMAAIEKSYSEDLVKLEREYSVKLETRKEQLEIETERALRELREELKANMNRERNRMIEENRATIEALREEHTNKITDLRYDYRAEVERLRTQHGCHLEELRARFANERAAKPEDRGLGEKYKCLKEKYARLKHDVKMSIERRNKRREMSMTTGSETEKSNSHKANHSLERCKELNETSVSAVIESEPKTRINNNVTSKCNDNETSYSESHAVKSDNNNGKDLSGQPTSSQSHSSSGKRPRRTTVAFKEPLRSRDKRDKDRDGGTTTDCLDSSDATTADEKPNNKESSGRRRCFTRLKSASTSRLNYSPRRGEGWASPLEALRQQLRKLDDLEEQFPDLECQPNYSLRYPFGEFGGVSKADTPELEFVRHRALVEREGMRRARAVLKRRKAALKETRGEVSPQSVQSARDVTELEVALHRARALLGEKEIRLRHIERALRTLTDAPEAPKKPPQTVIQEATTSEASSASDDAVFASDGAVLRSLRALHADVRDIWRALDVTTRTVSPESNSFNPTTSSQHRMAFSAPTQKTQDNSEDGGISERAKGLRAWLQTAP